MLPGEILLFMVRGTPLPIPFFTVVRISLFWEDRLPLTITITASLMKIILPLRSIQILLTIILAVLAADLQILTLQFKIPVYNLQGHGSLNRKICLTLPRRNHPPLRWLVAQQDLLRKDGWTRPLP